VEPLTKIDIGPTQGPGLQQLAKDISEGKDPYIQSVRDSPPLLLAESSDGLRTQAAHLAAEIGKSIKGAKNDINNVNESQLTEKKGNRDMLGGAGLGLGIAAIAGAGLYNTINGSPTLMSNTATALGGIAVVASSSMILMGENKDIQENKRQLTLDTQRIKGDIDKAKEAIPKLSSASRERINLAKGADEFKALHQKITHKIEETKAGLHPSSTLQEKQNVQTILDTLDEMLVKIGAEVISGKNSALSQKDYEGHTKSKPLPEVKAGSAELANTTDDWLEGLPQEAKKINIAKKKTKGRTKANQHNPTISHQRNNTPSSATVTPEHNKLTTIETDEKKDKPIQSQPSSVSINTKKAKNNTPTMTTQDQAAAVTINTKKKAHTATHSKDLESIAKKAGLSAAKATVETKKLTQSFMRGDVVGEVSSHGGVHAGLPIKISNVADTKSLVMYSSDFYTGNTKRFEYLEQKLQDNPSAGKPLTGPQGKSKIFEMKLDNTAERLYFHHNNGAIEILGKSDKSDQDSTIAKLQSAVATQARG